MDKTTARLTEHSKYATAYDSPRYAMGQDRMRDALSDLTKLNCRGSYLDVSCGRGEMLDHALQIGFDIVRGTEIVPRLIEREFVEYAAVHSLPFGDSSFEVVSMFDVIEHLLPGDDKLACKELMRVASSQILITASNNHSFSSSGDDLHINIRAYDEWDELFRDWFVGAKVYWIKARNNISQSWCIEL